MSEKQMTELDGELLEELRRRADESGRTESELLEEAVRSYLEMPRSLDEVFESVDLRQRENEVQPLSEEEAMRLAVEEQRARRRERHAG